jgi:hypothetical protein
MYGGLFGDLPAAKNASKEEDHGAGDRSAVPKPPSDESNQIKASKEPMKSESSMVKSIGAAGTSMAFVPTAALNRRRNNERPAPAAPSSFSFSLVPTSQRQDQPLSSQTETKRTELATGWSVQVEEAKPTLDPAADTDASSHTIPASIEPQEVNHADDHLDLHKKVSQDPYDPMIPNDLLQYWENKALAVERERLEREAQETFEEQQRLRQQLEREREELHKAGNVDMLAEHHTKRSMGRGRGLSNLPAWLVEKQRKEREATNDGGQ